jgi:hypothetical protein
LASNKPLADDPLVGTQGTQNGTARDSSRILHMRCLILLLGLLSAIARAQVPRGTAIHLMLLKDISSTASMVGDVVPLVVTEDIEIEDHLLIPEGTMLFAKVVQSRREGALSAPLFDKPARLAIGLGHLRDMDGREVKLLPTPKREGNLEIKRELTVKPNSAQSKEFEMALGNPESHSAAQKLRALFSDAATSLSEKEAEILIQHNVRMPIVQEAIRTGAFGRVVHFIRDLKRGHLVDAALVVAPLSPPAMLAVRAVRELCRVSGGISGYIEGRFKGRNIRCSAGVEFTVYAG